MTDKVTKTEKIAISIVSHAQGQIVAELLNNISSVCDSSQLTVVLTINCFEELPFAAEDFPFPLTIIRNSQLQGFGANHNQAFKVTDHEYFCVLNPDVTFQQDPFPGLIQKLHDNQEIGIIAPAAYSAEGILEDSARKIPTPWRIFKRVFMKKNGLDYSIDQALMEVDWVAGMFMLFRHEDYKSMRGFDERYHLYLEDVDLCSRMWLSGKKVIITANETVVHSACRSSHTNLLYLKWHLSSMLRFLFSAIYFKRLWQLRYNKNR